MLDDIKAEIESALPDATVYVACPMNDDTHFEALVISPQFSGLSLVRQHQLVMTSLTEAFSTRLHALALKTFSPEKWEAEKHKYFQQQSLS